MRLDVEWSQILQNVVTIEILTKNNAIMALSKYVTKNYRCILTTHLRNTPPFLLERLGYLGRSSFIYAHGEDHTLSLEATWPLFLCTYLRVCTWMFHLGELHIQFGEDLRGFKP
jgi:hypothetical protein